MPVSPILSYINQVKLLETTMAQFEHDIKL